MKMDKRVSNVFQNMLDMFPKFMERDQVGFEEAFLHFLPYLLYVKMILKETYNIKAPITSKVLEDLFSLVYAFGRDEDQSDFWEEINKSLEKVMSFKKKSSKKY